MRFFFEGSKIVCRRTDNNIDRDTLVDVVEFDAHVGVIPPHVMGFLTSSERRELNLFLAEKKRLEAKSADTIVLEALPTLIEKVRDLLATLELIDEDLHQQLTKSTNRLKDILLEVRVRQRVTKEKDGAMRKDEALKKRLDIIKHSL